MSTGDPSLEKTGMQTVTVEKIITFIKPCNADFGHAFDDSIGSLSCSTASDRLPPLPPKPPNSELVSVPPLSPLPKSSQCQVLLTVSLLALSYSLLVLMAPAYVLSAS